MILSVRTDKPEAEIGLFEEDGQEIAYDKWHAHRELGSTLNERIEVFLQASSVEWSDIQKIVYFSGPGSFTGLRIGASVVNALSYAYSVPVVSSSGEGWVSDVIALEGEISSAKPVYGSEAFTTKQKK